MCLHLCGHSHSKGKGNTQAHHHAMLIRNFQSVLMLSTSIQYMQTKIKRAFIRLIMGLGGNDKWVRDEFLANVELEIRESKKTPKFRQSPQQQVPNSISSHNAYINKLNIAHYSINLKATKQIQTQNSLDFSFCSFFLALFFFFFFFFLFLLLFPLFSFSFTSQHFFHYH